MDLIIFHIRSNSPSFLPSHQFSRDNNMVNFF